MPKQYAIGMTIRIGGKFTPIHIPLQIPKANVAAPGRYSGRSGRNSAATGRDQILRSQRTGKPIVPDSEPS